VGKFASKVLADDKDRADNTQIDIEDTTVVEE